MLLIAVAASIACLIWIALDAGTGDVFLVYGCMIRTAWQMKAWSVFVSCGWRLAVIVGVILLNVSLAYRATISNSADLGTATLIGWCFAVVLAIGLVPWTFKMSILRQRRLVAANAMMLAETAEHLSTLPDLSLELNRAEYTTESGWDAWHPNSERFQSAEGQKLWTRVVPVIYTSAEFPRTVVIPIDWSSFCVWGRPPAFAHSGKLLPFYGPGTSRFRAGSCVHRLETPGDCWIVQAELQLPDETEEAGRKNCCN
jgi:hypothetical protein